MVWVRGAEKNAMSDWKRPIQNIQGAEMRLQHSSPYYLLQKEQQRSKLCQINQKQQISNLMDGELEINASKFLLKTHGCRWFIILGKHGIIIILIKSCLQTRKG